MKYDNEAAVGEAIQECIAAGVKREDLFITTKLWHTDKNDVEAGIKTSLAKLKLDYVDLYLIHWMRPQIDWDNGEKILTPPNHIVWAGMESLVEKGLTKSIGVSNCTIPLLYDILAGCKIKPVINQVECHPYFQQTRVNEFHQKYGIFLESYASVGSGHFTRRKEEYKDVSVLDDAVIKEIATAKGKTPAQIILAWHVQRKCIPLVKTTKEARLLENISSAYEVDLTTEDVKKIDALDADIRLFNPKFMENDWFGMPYWE